MFLDTKALQWKLSRMETNHKTSGKNVKFHSNLHIPSDLICTFWRHTGKVGLTTLMWDQEPKTLGWDPKVGP